MSAKRAFVIGYPIKHSRSPLIHNYWLSKYDIPGSYEKLEVPPDRLDAFLSEMDRAGYCGGNVTLPYKERVFAACATVTEMARRIGAVNTLWREGDRLCGDNTDVGGFLANLAAESPDWNVDCDRAAVIGAGGAARAILVGLASRGIPEVKLLNRSSDRMLKLAEEAESWGFRRIRTQLLNDDRGALDGEALLVNTTSLGMTGQPKLSINLDGLRQTAVVSDIVYSPLETDLLADARRRGHRISSGLGMLLHQAAPGFERWFGVRPEVTPELRNLIIDDLQQAHS
ncbi:shikimate dehydrogenase [Rhodoblastus sp.]|jgi:shikimate dehydrogenase|uniref:shikimate dehydrogenase n=1 Tax=Rhodoblastus sp. TaxID=1962975 RepID=UPI0025E9757E|nr:shikimate dehydrogenase [Rhodoblastus sp.]